MELDCCPEDLNKKAPCWEGYVQRGMKPGKNGKPVPNCIPAKKADDLWSDIFNPIQKQNTRKRGSGNVFWTI